MLGIGGDTLICENQPVPLSSVEHDQERTGYEGAALLDKLMKTGPAKHKAQSAVLIPPTGITTRASTDRMAVSSPILRKALAFIKENLSHPIGIGQIAERIGTSRATLDRLFKSEMDRSAGQEILRQRMALAKSLLANEELSIAQIAAECGFCNQAYLTNLFKATTGLTPLKYRNQLSSKIRAGTHAAPG